MSNWKLPRGSMNDYASAPRLRSISKGVTQRRERAWLERWLFEPDKMIEERDPIALQLYEEYGQLPMPNSHLNQVEVDSILRFLDDEGRRLAEHNSPSGG